MHEVVPEKLKLISEYQHQKVSGKKTQFDSETNRAGDILAVKADYKLNDKVDLALGQQVSVKGSANNQTTMGIAAKFTERLSLRGKEAIGNDGAATSLGMTLSPFATPNVSGDNKKISLRDSLALAGDYTKTVFNSGQIGDTVSLSTAAKLDEKTDVHGTYSLVTSGPEGEVSSFVYGSKKKLTDKLDLASDRSYASSDQEKVSYNIYKLSGEINEHWASQGAYERGIVQNYNGTQNMRNAISLGLGFVDRDKKSGRANLKNSAKIELRFDDGQENQRQYLFDNVTEGKINQETTLFTKINLSQSKNTSTDSSMAQYKEFSFGAAHRPINLDRLNLLTKYTYLDEDAPASQNDISDILKERSHVFAVEGIYELTDKWQIVNKLAYKIGKEMVSGFGFTKTETWLAIARFNYNFYKQWQVGAEYRALGQTQAKDRKNGALVELAYRLDDFAQLGVGYNFTEFNDNLTHLDYTAQGPFIRVTGAFFDRTPGEIEKAREKVEQNRQKHIEVQKQARIAEQKRRRHRDIHDTLRMEEKKYYRETKFEFQEYFFSPF